LPRTSSTDDVSGNKSPSSYFQQKIDRLSQIFGASRQSPSNLAHILPFSADDITAGSENEYQAAVLGSKEHVDLPLTLETSNFYKNIVNGSTRRGTKRVATELEKYLENNTTNIWENSWVRFPRRALSHFANQVLAYDLLANKKESAGPCRQDVATFLFSHQSEEWIRIPVSYLLRLALADAIGRQARIPLFIRQLGERLMNHFLNDNTSPETFSFSVMHLRPKSGMGTVIGKEASKRFFLSHLLTMYANQQFGLDDTGQHALVYSAPHPPIRQKTLNSLISDSFYRELFMNPCLSGWDSGQDKHQYMQLCHEVLSRSHLNTIGKLKESGIITRNLIVPSTPSNISLANNGTHISLGSQKLSTLCRSSPEDFSPKDEKYFGDLVTKIIEHFLPLFVGTYSAAPYRFDFWDFHPEKVLGFLPHELDHQFLQLVWQRWRRKARLRLLGNPFTPIGPLWLDRLLSVCFRMKGDYIPDSRLIDYLVVLPSTEQCPSLDGSIGNEERLKKDLAQLGIYDQRMSFYHLYKLRAYSQMGFSGFEGRYYSLFEHFEEDMGQAASLQALVTALAYKYIFRLEINPVHIPDHPSAESERRQIFFGSALGLPTFYVRANTSNLFLRKILDRTNNVRMSRRFPSYIRVHHHQYRQALLRILQEDAGDLIESFHLKEVLGNLKDRLDHPQEHSAFGKLTKGILEEAGTSSYWNLSGEEYNRASEQYYRNTLRKRQIVQAFESLEQDCRHLDSRNSTLFPNGKSPLRSILGPKHSATSFLAHIKPDLLAETLDGHHLTTLIHLVLVTIYLDSQDTPAGTQAPTTHEPEFTSVH